MKQLKDSPRQASKMAYRVWFDKRCNQLVTYNRHWKKDDWNNLIEVGQLQPHQNPFEQDEKGIFRTLYERKRYYFVF